ncbi:MAG: N4-gp56 family major capsid protein [Clostridia bacterium]|nr:N4-gp56 family major capsid protein [Clostridia bacterium]
MPTNTTESTGLSPEMKTYYDRLLLERMKPNLPFLKYGQKRPIKKGNGKTIEFRKFNSLAPATTPLTEGEPPVATELSVTSINATVKQYGAVVEVTDVLETTAIDPVIAETVELEGEQAGETLNIVVRDILLNTTSVFNVGGGVDEDSIAANHVLTADDILKIQTIFRRKNIKPVSGGYYLMFLAPEQAADIMRDPLWRDVSKYGNDAKNIEDGEIGRIFKFKFIDTTLVDAQANATGVNVYSGLAMGNHAYGIVDIENGSKPKTIVKIAKDDDSDRSDPLNQKSTIGWKALLTAVRLNELALMRVNSAATDVA